MITITFDETGEFEHLSGEEEVPMIAGVAYDDAGEPGEAERECERIKSFFMKICRKEFASYPGDLHFNRGGSNGALQNRVKNAYCRELGDFLKRGFCEGRQILSNDNRARKGQYHVFVMAKSQTGKTSFSGEGIDSFIRDESASNLYLHMAEDTVSRLLFYSELLSEKDVSLNLATRSLPERIIQDGDQYDRKGHVRYGSYYSITNADVFHTALYREMMASDHKRVRVSGLRASSIKYHAGSSGEPGMEFLYLADAICTLLSGRNNKLHYSEGYQNTLIKRVKELSIDGQGFVFFYDDADTLFTKAWDYLESGDLYESVAHLYRATHADSEAAKFYQKRWEPVLKKRYTLKADQALLKAAAGNLSGAVKRSNLNVQELLYIYETLETVTDNMKRENPEESAFVVDLYLAGITIYNHCGKSRKAKRCGEKAAEYETRLGIGEYLTYCNRRAVTMCDTLRFEEAKAYALSSYRLGGEICNARKVHHKEYRPGLEYAKVCSQLGQCCGFLGDNHAETFFSEALSHMEAGTPDYNITLSYLMHYYLDRKDAQHYAQCAKTYFGGHEKADNRLEYILKETGKGRNALVDFRFAVFLLVKGIYVFGEGDLSRNMIDKLLHFESFLRKKTNVPESFMTGYPWQIIYKYLALIAIRQGKKDAALRYLDYLEVFPQEHRLIRGERKSNVQKDMAGEREDTDILTAIRKHCVLAVRDALGQKTKDYKSLCENTLSVLSEINPDIKKRVTHGEHSLAAIERILTYTYH